MTDCLILSVPVNSMTKQDVIEFSSYITDHIDLHGTIPMEVELSDGRVMDYDSVWSLADAMGITKFVV